MIAGEGGINIANIVTRFMNLETGPALYLLSLIYLPLENKNICGDLFFGHGFGMWL
jgi:hypothetical protein